MNRCIVNSLIALFLICVIVSELSACLSTDFKSSSIPTYWEDNTEGTIKTNDLERLQKEIPFTMLLPEYLPEESNFFKVDADFRYLNQYPVLTIFYHHKTQAKEIYICEGPPSDSIPRPLPPGLLTKMFPDTTPIETDGKEVLEHVGVDDIIIDTKRIQVSSFQYLWETDNIRYSISILGYDKDVARKVVKSMIK